MKTVTTGYIALSSFLFFCRLMHLMFYGLEGLSSTGHNYNRFNRVNFCFFLAFKLNPDEAIFVRFVACDKKHATNHEAHTTSHAAFLEY